MLKATHMVCSCEMKEYELQFVISLQNFLKTQCTYEQFW